jgi:hypothetical protein
MRWPTAIGLIAADPGNAKAHSNRGKALTALGRNEEPLASHDWAIALKPR